MLRRLHDQRGLAGIEFAVVVPVILILLCGVVDLSRAILLTRRLTVAAAATATIASTMAVQASSLNSLTGPQAWQASTVPFAYFPEWLSQPHLGSFAITLSAVNFSQAAGGYTAHVAWSVVNPAGQTLLRPCGTLGLVAANSPASLSTLPVDSAGATSLIVADLSGMFVPVFTSVFLGPFAVQRSAYVSPRINNGVALVGSFPGQSVTCPAAS